MQTLEEGLDYECGEGGDALRYVSKIPFVDLYGMDLGKDFVILGA